MKDAPRILIIQTAFIGDVVLATPLVSELKRLYPESKIEFLLRKGNESLLEEDPRLNKVWVWDKKKGKYKDLWRILKEVRSKRFDLLINVQRFFTTGLFSFLVKAKTKVGFSKNPWSFIYDRKVDHQISNGFHEVDRNLQLIQHLGTGEQVRPSLHLTHKVLEKVAPYKKNTYITIAPASVWFTKQFPRHQWVSFLRQLTFEGTVYLIGAPSDHEMCEQIRNEVPDKNIQNLCGKLHLLESAALMRDAQMNYVNDSAPMHFASAVNAPTTAIFCSTVPEFGFGPLSQVSRVVEVQEKLSCRPCGLHGYRSCPKGHFKCAEEIQVSQLNF
jgi:heptosyltransferase-2